MTTRTLVWTVIAALVVALASPSPADAQPDPDRREKIKKRIRALRAYTLTEELGLDENSASRLFPILARYDDEMGRHLAARFKLKQDLDTAIARGDDRNIDKLIDGMVANQSTLHALDTRRFAEVRKVLTPRQSARLLVVLPAIERKVQNMVQRALQGRGAGRRGGGRRAADPLDAPEGDLIDPFEGRSPKRGRRRAAPANPFTE